MTKKIMLTAVLAVAVMGAAEAAPLKDYSAGKVALDLGFSFGAKVNGSSAKEAMNGALTVGLGNNWAAQYKYDNYQASRIEEGKLGVQKHELNVLYKINPMFSAYAGWVRGNFEAKMDGEGDKFSKNTYQVGIQGQVQLAPKLTGWGSAALMGAGYGLEAGLGYEVVKNVDLNLGYKYTRLRHVGDDSTFAGRGFFAGASYKF